MRKMITIAVAIFGCGGDGASATSSRGEGSSTVGSTTAEGVGSSDTSTSSSGESSVSPEPTGVDSTGDCVPTEPMPYTGVVSTLEELRGLATRHWAVVANSRPDLVEKQPRDWLDFDGSVSASYESYQRVVGYSSIVLAWGGGVAGEIDGVPYMLLFGGGHNDYGGNEVVAFNIDDLAWTRLTDPTAFPDRAPEFQNADGTPVSRHTYSGLAFIQHREELFAFGGAPDADAGGCGIQGTWRFDLASNGWSLGTMADEPTTSCDDLSAYDPIEGRVYYFSSGQWSVYDPDTDVWTASALTSLPHQSTAAIDPQRRIIVTAGGGQTRIWDLEAGLGEQRIATRGPTDVQDADDPGLEYDPRLDRMVGYAGGASVYALDVDQGIWEELAPAGDNLVVPENDAAGGVFGRFRYIPAHDVYVYISSTERDVLVYRASDSPCPP